MSEIEQRRNEVLQLKADTEAGTSDIQQQDDELETLRGLLGKQEAAADEIQGMLGQLIAKAEALVTIGQEVEEQSKVVYQGGVAVVMAFGGLVDRGARLLEHTDSPSANNGLEHLRTAHGETNLAGIAFSSIRTYTGRTRESSLAMLEDMKGLDRRLRGIEADAIERNRETNRATEHYSVATQQAKAAAADLSSYAGNL